MPITLLTSESKNVEKIPGILDEREPGQGNKGTEVQETSGDCCHALYYAPTERMLQDGPNLQPNTRRIRSRAQKQYNC